MKANRTYIEAITTALTQETGIRFKEGKGFSTDTEKKIITYNQNQFNQMDIEVAKGIILHEAGHLKHTYLNKPSELQKNYPVLQDIYNIAEDMRIEDKLIQEYGDFAGQSLTGSNLMGLEAIQNTPEIKERAELRSKYGMDEIEKLKPLDKLQQFKTGFIADTIQNSYNHNRLDKIGVYLDKGHGQEKYIPTLTTETRDRLDNDVNNVLNDIDSNIYSLLREAKNTKELEDIIDKYIYPKIKDWIKPNQQPQQQNIQQQTIQQAGKGDCEMDKSRPVIPSDNEIDALLKPFYTTLARRLKDVLKENATIKWNGNYRSGKLLSKNAYKVILGEDRIFSKRNNPDVPKYTISMLIDSSGSMAGTRHYNIYHAGYLLKRACQLLGFKIRFYKYSNEVYRLDDLSGYREFLSGCNDDKQGLEKVIEDIDQSEENIVLHLTDGSLCTDITQPLNRLKAMRVNTIGIGIETEEVKRVFPQSVVVKKVEELPLAIINLLRKLIHRN